MDVGIIGCGSIGRKRARALSSRDRLIACCDTNPTKGEAFHLNSTAAITMTIGNSSGMPIGRRVVSVVNRFDSDIVVEALSHKRQVLVENRSEEIFRKLRRFSIFRKPTDAF